MTKPHVLSRIALATITAATLTGAVATSASAAPASDLTAEQQATIKALNTPAKVQRQAESSGASVTPAATYGARLSLYRGSVLMWARDTMTWYYTGSSMVSSYLGQEAGYIFPNVSQAKGTARYYASSWTHAQVGRYTIGAGVLTPWGAATVYAQDYSTDWHVYGNGAGNGRWNN